jgi:hypothetical protein
MIDTIVLELPYMDYIITDHEQFNPPTYNVSSGRPLLKYINNPSSQDKKAGIYKPRLTVMKRQYSQIPLRIEFSIPKLIFGNNLDEVQIAHIPQIFSKLQEVLKSMGVNIQLANLKDAKVLAVHYSKNVLLSSGYTASLAIKELAKVNLTKQLDLSKTEFRNEGHSLQYYAKSNSFVMYDKVKDLKQGKGRAIDKDQNHLQSSIFEVLKNQSPDTEILRLEVRLCSRRKIHSLFRKLGFNITDARFKDVFNINIAQGVLKYYWQEMVINKNRFLFLSHQDSFQTFKTLIKDNKPKQAFYLLGLFTLSKEKGLREVRQALARHSNDRTWQRMQADLKTLNQLGTVTPAYGFIDDIETTLNEFKPFKLSNKLYLSLC